MTTDQVIASILNELSGIEGLIRENMLDNTLEPPYHWVYVDDVPVFNRTGNLEASISTRVRTLSGNNLAHEVYVSKGAVPYYQEAILSPTREVIYHWDDFTYKREYGSYRPSNGYVVGELANRNYMHFMKAEPSVKAIVQGKIGGNKKYYVSDSIDNWRE